MPHSTVQSVLFPKSEYTIPSARKWLTAHKYHSEKVDQNTKFWRFRQEEPVAGAKFHTVMLGNGVELVVEDTVKVSESEEEVSESESESEAEGPGTKAQNKHRALFGKWAKAKSGKTFKDWLMSR